MTKTENKRPPGPDQKLKLRHFIEYGLVLLLWAVVYVLPLSVSRAAGRVIGWLFITIDRRHRDIALLNLDQAFGDSKTEEEKRSIVKNCFYHFGAAIMETLFLRTISQKRLERMITFENVALFDEALAEGKGLILCSAHYGNWEIMNLALGFRGIPMSAMARPLDNPLVHKFLENVRVRPGNRVIYKHKSVRKIFANLKENRVVGIVNDQDVHDRNRTMVPFFGRDAATTPVPAAVSIKTGAPIITGYAQPLDDGSYLLAFGELIRPNQDAPKEEETERITLLLNKRLEEQLEKAPDYWMWMHKRFKTGEEGITDFYKLPRKKSAR